MTSSPSAPAPFDGQAFRAVLGNYPTGVVVVTALVEGQPVGMVIGSFTSASLDPPLVAFLPMKTSGTYAQIQKAESFCINVLSADQEDLCRLISSRAENKFSSLTWTSAPSGAPIINGVVAWMDCTPAGCFPAGDHDIVLGAVTALAVERESLPLLFFQGGYGRFAPGALVMGGSSRSLVEAVQTTSTLRHHLEAVADGIGCECSVIAADGDEGVFLASAAASGLTAEAPIGARMPIRAPIQPLFVSDAGPVTPSVWLSGVGSDPSSRQSALALLERVDERGWSLSIRTGSGSPNLDQLVSEFASLPRTPARDREFLALVTSISMEREPEDVRADNHYDVSGIAVPVTDADGRTTLVLKLGQLPSPATGEQVLAWVVELQGVARLFVEALQGDGSRDT